MPASPEPNREELIAECIIAVTCPWCAAAPKKICITWVRRKGGMKRTAFVGRTHQARDKAGMKLFHKTHGSPLAVRSNDEPEPSN